MVTLESDTIRYFMSEMHSVLFFFKRVVFLDNWRRNYRVRRAPSTRYDSFATSVNDANSNARGEKEKKDICGRKTWPGYSQ